MTMMMMMIRRRCFSHHNISLLNSAWSHLSRSAAWLSVCPARARSASSSLASRLGPQLSAVGYNDYETERRTFRLEQPEFYNFASDVIDRWALNEQVRCDVVNMSIL